MTLAAGTKLGPYEIQSPLGAGGMGEVYKARDTRLAREVAIKVLPASLSDDADRLRRFEQEARAASALNHPNIVTVHDIGRERETAYIAMELVDGKTLRELAASGPMALRRIVAVAAQIAEGLAKAHAAGIVHRDLKPENVMLSKDGFVKILDFGLAKLVEPESGEMSAMPTLAQPETHPGTVMGTVAYMSPEQASGEALDFRSDQFSLGSILYELTTGQKAFQKKTAAETMSAIIREEPEPVASLRPDLPLPVRWMLDRCLAKDREERYASTRDLARDLASVRDHISEVTSGSGALLAATPQPRRRIPALALGLAVLAAAAAAGWLARGRMNVPSSAPKFTRLTYRLGEIANARFAPDGRTIVYGARWAGDPPGNQLYRSEVGSPESARFDFAGDILAISRSNELAIQLQPAPGRIIGTLARVPMAGGKPRQVLEGVPYAGADFSPDGTELAVVHEVEGRLRLEFPIGKVLLPEKAWAPRVSRDGRSVALWTEVDGSNAVVVIGRDGGGQRVLSGGWDGDTEGAACWSPGGREIWFTASAQPGQAPSLWAVDLSGRRRLVMRVPGGIELDDISPDGRVLLGHFTKTQTVRFASSKDPVERELSWLDGSIVADLSSDARMLLLNEVGEGSGGKSVIYLRGTDGSAAVKLGEGDGFTLSPDGKWVLSSNSPAGGKPESMSILPTGPGQAHALAALEGFMAFNWGAWLPDGRSVIYSAVSKDGSRRLYMQAIPDGKPQPIGPETLNLTARSNPVSPDGRFVVGTRLGEAHLVPLDGSGSSRLLPGLSPPADRIVQWTADSRSLYVQSGQRGSKVWLYDIASGQRRLWKEIPLDDTIDGARFRVTPDGSAWVYFGQRTLSEIYLVEGLR